MRLRFLGTVATGAMVAISGSAYAQDKPAEPDTSSQLGDIVVTAQRRGENIQSVPISITAASAKDLDQMHIDTTRSLELLAPSLKIPSLVGTVSPTVRAVGNLDPSASNSANVATYVDGIYYPSLAGQVFNLAGVERIEILNGPQGTLFGRNANGGAIQVVTKDPSQTPSGMLRVGYGNYDTVSLSFYGTTGITANVATDLAASFDNQYKGWGRNLTLGGDVNKQKSIAIRNKWLFDFGSTKITLAGDYLQHNEAHIEALAPGYIPIPSSIVPQGSIYDTQEGFAFKAPYINQWGVSAKIEQTFDWAKLVSLSSYRELRTRADNSLSQSPVSPVVFESVATDHDYTEELQLLSPSSSRISWIVGAFFMNRNSAYQPFKITGLEFNGPPFCFTPNCTGSLTTFDSSGSRSLAGYAQTTIPLGAGSDGQPAKTRLTLGARYTIDHITLSGTQDFGAFAVSVPPGTAKTYRRATFRAVLDHKFTPNVMTYVSFNTGYKAGLYNLGGPADPPTAPESLNAYEAGIKADFLDKHLRVNISAFHYDYKDVQLTIVVPTGTQLVNAAAAKIDGVDFSIDALPVNGLRLTASGEFLPRAKYVHFPSGTTSIPCVVYVTDPLNPGPLCKYYPGGNAQFNVDLSGNRMIMAPKFSLTLTANYTFHAFALNASYKYQSKFYSTVDNNFPLPGYGVVNLGLNWTSPGDKWRLGVWADNVLDKKYIVRINAPPYAVGEVPGAPLTFGANVTRNF